MTAIRPLVAGNWKMNGLTAALAEAQSVHEGLAATPAEVDVMICPPATLVSAMAALLAGGPILVGGQDCHAAPSGAHTGDISAEMLADAGAKAAIVGHSERRSDHGETSRVVLAKAEAAHRAGLTAIVCVGETAGERAAGLTLDVVKRQVLGSLPVDSHAQNTIIAYEPVWAIGTGLTPTPDDVASIHAAIRALATDQFKNGNDMRILYGGSVKPANAAELMAVDNVNGALVGGASLKAEDFLGIIEAYTS
jgi:triosephosphate isomerase (TIM)